jgi:hypothetical protein
VEVFAAGGKGFGVRLLEPVREGQMLLEYLGEVIGARVRAQRMEAVSIYCLP